ncbi:hypothetical protein ACFORL_07260 [Legionella dresdenensis]|uniref:Uncharacterized protein n=1 Tax=Legionella dresdenensis TaxID=450200 RepID=A0ABV8CEW1_9GAMM
MYYDYINSDERIKGNSLHNQAVEQVFNLNKAKQALRQYQAGLRKINAANKDDYKSGVYEENLVAALTDILYESCNTVLYVLEKKRNCDDLDKFETIWRGDLEPKCQQLHETKSSLKNIHKKTTLFKGIVDAYNALGTAFERISDTYLDLKEARIDSNESPDKLQEYELKASQWMKRAIEYYERAGSKIAKNSHTEEELQETVNIHRGFLTLLHKEFLHTNDINSMVCAKQHIEKYNLLLIECDALEKLDILGIAVKASDVLGQPKQDLLAQINSIIPTLSEDELQNDIVTYIKELINCREPGESADASDMNIVDFDSDTDEELDFEEELDSEVVVETVAFESNDSELESEQQPNNDMPQSHKRSREETLSSASDDAESVEPSSKRSALTRSDNQEESTASRDLTTSTQLQTVAPPAESDIQSIVQPALPTPQANEYLEPPVGIVNHPEQAMAPENTPILIKPRPEKGCLKDPNKSPNLKTVRFLFFTQDKIQVYPVTSLPALAPTDSENAEGYSTEDLSLMAFNKAIHSFIEEHKPQIKHEEFLGDILACIAFHFQNREKEFPLLNIKLYSTAFRLAPHQSHVKGKMGELFKNKSLRDMCASHSEFTSNPDYFMRAKAILPAPASTPAPGSPPVSASARTPVRNRVDRAPRSAKALARMAAPPAPVLAPARSGMELFTSAINYMLAELEGSNKNLVVTEIRKLVASLSTRSSFKKMTVDFCEQYYDAALETLHRTHADSAPAPRM